MVFSVQGTGGSTMGPDPENRMGDQDIGSPGRSVSSGLQVPGEPFPSWSGKDFSAPLFLLLPRVITSVLQHIVNNRKKKCIQYFVWKVRKGRESWPVFKYGTVL
jgi:hypothetical protein